MAERVPRSLTRKYNALAYERGQLLSRLAQVDEELRCLNYALRIVSPDWRPPKKATKPQAARKLPRGKISATCLKLLRQQPGLGTTQLAKLTAKQCGVAFATTNELQDFASAIAMALRRYERRGFVEMTGQKNATGELHWRIRPMPVASQTVA